MTKYYVFKVDPSSNLLVLNGNASNAGAALQFYDVSKDRHVNHLFVKVCVL